MLVAQTTGLILRARRRVLAAPGMRSSGRLSARRRSPRRPISISRSPRSPIGSRASGARRVEVVFGASGTLTRQIQDGAPFELFLAADEEFPNQLDGGRADP